MRPKTLGELKIHYRPRSVKEEIRENLMQKLKKHKPVFTGVVGYEETVVPQVVNALLAKQNFILLGLRGQAKSRILRELSELLDPEIPVIKGSEIHDDPFQPISSQGKKMLAEFGDSMPIEWLPREIRYVEKLATPDVTVADLIGDVDPIKAARLGKTLGDELTIHFGLLPRANRGIFAINELADLAPKVQVALFNIMQEGDVQIKGYPVRLPLDVLLVFSANPEDYTARGKIVTPLKDRIGSEIRTHYPFDIEQGVAITKQEAWIGKRAKIPTFIAELVEEVAFQAREDNRIDRQSGVSQRLPISLLELAASNAERRALLNKDKPVARPLDIYAGLPSITGKLELEYEGELIGAENIAREIIKKAAGVVFGRRAGRLNTKDLEAWFEAGNALRLPEGQAKLALAEIRKTPLFNLAVHLAEGTDDDQLIAAAEFILEGLWGRHKVSRSEEMVYTAAETETTRRSGRFN